jgi:ribosome recycling factor
MVKMLKSDGLSEDLAKDAEAKVQSITNNAITKVDEILAVKEKDIMTV